MFKNSGAPQVTRPPIIIYDKETLTRVQYIMTKQPTEWQWFHRVKRIVDSKRIFYYIDDLIIPEQVVGGTDVETDPMLIAKMWQDLKRERDLQSLEELNPIIQSTSAWCHSHVHMATSPSKTDQEMWEEWKTQQSHNKDQPCIMIILNKRNECYTRVWDPILALEFSELQIIPHEPTDCSDLDDVIKTKFKPKPTKTHTSTFTNTNSNTTNQSTHKPTTGVMKANGHKAECDCDSCKYTQHLASCWCLQCQGKKKSTPTVMNQSKNTDESWKRNIYSPPRNKSEEAGKPGDNKKNHRISSNPSLSSNVTQTAEESSGEKKAKDSSAEFYLTLTDAEWIKLKHFAKKLNNVSATNSISIVNKIMDIINSHLNDIDMYSVLAILECGIYGHYSKLLSLEDWYFVDLSTETQEEDTEKYIHELKDFLIGTPIHPPHLLPMAVQFALRAGAMPDQESLDSIVTDYFDRMNTLNKIEQKR